MAAPIVPLDSLHLAVHRDGRGYVLTVSGHFSDAQSAVGAIVQVGSRICAGTWTTELRRAEQQTQRYGYDAAGAVVDKELGTGPVTSGPFTASGSWGARAPAGVYLACAYLVGPEGFPSTPRATASAPLTIGAASAPAVVTLHVGDVVTFAGTDVSCYAFAHVFPENSSVKTPPGINCFIGKPGVQIDEENWSATLYAPASGRPNAFVVTSGDVQGTCFTGCWKKRTAPGADGTDILVAGEDIACRYRRSSSLDAGRPGLTCFATAGAPRIDARTGRITNVAGAGSIKVARVELARAHNDVVTGVSGFFLDHRIVAGLKLSNGSLSLVHVTNVCDPGYSTTCHNGIAG
jgi:hypothetical protein